MLDTYYPNRSSHLENVCLYEVLQNYIFKRNIKEDIDKGVYAIIGSEGCLVKQRKCHLVNHRKLSGESPERKEFFYLALLQLFKPWRAEEELLGDFLCYEDSFNAAKETIECPVFPKYLEMLNAEIEQEATIAAEIARDSSQDSQSSVSLSQDPLGGPVIQNEAATAMIEVERAMAHAQEDAVNLEDLERQLNVEQRKIYDEVTNQIDHGLSHEKKECSCTSLKPVRLYVSGEAGTGKSFLIKAISCYLQKRTESSLSCVVTAPTGLAAHNIKGITLHRLLMLPVEHDNKLQYHKLSGDACCEVSRVLRKMKLLIIDEVSMGSNVMLAFVHLRMQEVLKTEYDVLFGGKHIIVFGDLLQLTPVKGQPVFKMLTHEDTRKCLGSIGNVNIWLNFNYAELRENMRQAKDEDYKNILQDVRIGKVTEHGKEALHARLLSNLYPEEDVVPENIFRKITEKKSGICLMPTLAECAIFNNKMLNLENQEIVKLEAIDRIEHMGATIILSENLKSKLDSLEKTISKTAGFEKTLNVCLNCRIILRRNLHVERGLVNGSMGNVVDFEKYRNRDGIEFLKIKFDGIEEVQLIGRCSARFLLVKDLYVRRKQFPVCLAYAVTIHKSQGLSVDSALVNIGSSVFKEGMAYVALSRVRTLSGLYLIDCDVTNICADLNCVKEYNRLRREYAPYLPQYPLFEKRVVGRKRRNVTNSREVVAKRRKVDEPEIISRKKMDSVEGCCWFSI
ncbi:ATP-dependent DNA helicase Pif1-like [Lissotriton helveticus]